MKATREEEAVLKDEKVAGKTQGRIDAPDQLVRKTDIDAETWAITSDPIIGVFTAIRVKVQ